MLLQHDRGYSLWPCCQPMRRPPAPQLQAIKYSLVALLSLHINWLTANTSLLSIIILACIWNGARF
eukprot:scaffold279924_cov14-Tisochrysis_lutea.AAC.1